MQSELPKNAIEYFKREKSKHAKLYQGFYDEAVAALIMMGEKQQETAVKEREYIRPIDAYALEDELFEMVRTQKTVNMEEIQKKIVNAPTIEVMRMKTGKWCADVTEGEGIAGYICSQCGRREPVKLMWCQCGAMMK